MAINSQTLSKERVLIVGCGDIGWRLAQCLSPECYQVLGLRRNSVEDHDFLRYQVCDVTDAAQLSAVLAQQFSIIVVSMTPSERSDVGYQRAYVQTCKNLIHTLKMQLLPPRLVVFISSSAVYGQLDGSWVDEHSMTEPEGFSGRRLLEAEQVILNSGVPSTVLRLSGIYGPGRNRLLEQVRQGCASPSTHFTNRIHADDAARSIAHVIECARQGFPLEPIYLVTDDTPAPMIEVVTWLAGQMHQSHFLSDTAVNERGNKRCSNQRLRDSGFECHYPSYREGYRELLSRV